MKVCNRIRANEDFAIAIKNGRALKSSSYTVHIFKTNGVNTRVGISVSKKLGGAVIRNRIKRQVRAICDSVIDYTNPGLDIVIVVRGGFLEKNFQENKQDLHQLIDDELQKGAH